LQLKFSRTKKKRVIVVGEFNNNIGDAGINTIERAGFRSAWMDLEIDVSKEFIDNARDSQRNSVLLIRSITTPRPTVSQQREVAPNLSRFCLTINKSW